MSNMAIILSISKGLTKLSENFKGLSHERGWKNSAENLGTFPFQLDLLIDTLSAKSISLAVLL